MLLDVVGLSLSYGAQKLTAAKCQYVVKHTFPTRDYFKVDEMNYYILRQSLKEGVYVLTVGAKMRKEVY